MELLKCIADSGHEPGCDDDACPQVESATYKISDARTDVSMPTAGEVLFEMPLSAPLASGRLQLKTAIPAEMRNSWQFNSRAALPPRAP